MSIRCLIVDDEPLASQLLADYVAKVPELSLAGRCSHPAQAFSILQKEQIDLLLLDIHMPDMTGIELLKSLPYRPLVILTTAHAQYALEGYALDVVDYLLKPVPFPRFLQAVAKVADRLRSRTTVQTSLPAEPEPEKEFLFVKQGYKSVKVAFEEILYLEGMKEYVAIHTAGRKLLRFGTMKGLEDLLPPGKFLRVHKSFVVAISRVEAYYGNTLEIGAHRIPVGRMYKEVVAAKFS